MFSSAYLSCSSIYSCVRRFLSKQLLTLSAVYDKVIKRTKKTKVHQPSLRLTASGDQTVRTRNSQI